VRLDSLLAHAPVGFAFFDREYRYVHVNEFLCHINGLPAEAHLGKPIRDVLPVNAKAVEPLLEKVFQTGQAIVNVEVHGETPLAPGEGRDWLTGWYPVPGSMGATSLVGAVVVEITDRKHLEEQLRVSERAAAEANRAKDHFLAVLSHELRTPLTPVVAAAGLLEEDPRLPADAQEDMAMIRRNIGMETRLINDLLDVTRIARGKLEMEFTQVDLGTVIRQAGEICAPDFGNKSLQLRLSVADGLVVNGDAARLQQVIWNLLNNAVKFTPAGGRIRITARALGDVAEIKVTDTGVGITSEAIGRIFAAFEQQDRGVTRHFGGLGLGLAICRAIVERHGGRISAASRGPGKGATLTVRLPLVHAPSSRPQRPETPAVHKAGPALQGLKVLLVEDHADTAMLVSRVLRRRGYEVEMASDVASALVKAQDREIDLLISDIGLPDGSGLDLMRQLQHGRAIPGIAVSGYAQESDLQKSREAGFSEHLVKPIDVDGLEAAIVRIGIGRSLARHGVTAR
jgi:signal transduction histidine kinase/CheY-like chemotaxis protein